MRKLLNTLYVTRQGTYLAKDGESVAIREGGEDGGQTLLRVPMHTLESIVCFGRVSASPPFMGFCGERRVLLSFLSEQGKFLARCQGATMGNILLRRQQYRLADEGSSAARVAQPMVLAKVANCRNVVLRAARESEGDRSALQVAAEELRGTLTRIDKGAPELEVLRGMEGEAAQKYFGVFDEMIVAQKADFQFRGRSRRPPMDRINALLSFVYTLLVHDCVAALESVGLDPYCGFLHRDRPGRPSLALDLMEELRPVVADRVVLTLVNRQQVQSGDFEERENGAVWLSPKGRKEVIAAWQEKKREEVTHPVVEERAAVGLFPFIQAMLLARHIRGDLEGYPSLLWR